MYSSKAHLQIPNKSLYWLLPSYCIYCNSVNLRLELKKTKIVSHILYHISFKTSDVIHFKMSRRPTEKNKYEALKLNVNGSSSG